MFLHEIANIADGCSSSGPAIRSIADRGSEGVAFREEAQLLPCAPPTWIQFSGATSMKSTFSAGSMSFHNGPAEREPSLDGIFLSVCSGLVADSDT